MMTVITQQNTENTSGVNLFSDYRLFYSNIYGKLQNAADEFFLNEFELRFMGISFEDNIFFYGDEYFVNKIPVAKTSSVIIKISSSLVSSLLDSAVGSSAKEFKLNKLTEIEAGIIKSFTVYVCKNIEDFLIKTEANKKILSTAVDYNFTFYARQKNKHKGKIILTIPNYMLPAAEKIPPLERFNINDFKNAKVPLTISAGSAKISLNDIKTIENGDIILLDNSDITQMSVSAGGKEVKFKINPNPSIIITINNAGGYEMEEETNVKAQNMWDSIIVDIVAEFDNVKLTLGELKQISEGLVIDVGSVYENKIKLRVENQVIASGELVILNDRYGVRIDSVKKSESAKRETVKTVKERELQGKEPIAQGKQSEAPISAKAPVKPSVKPAAGNIEQNKHAAVKTAAQRPASAARPAVSAKQASSAAAKQTPPKKEGDENFDYSDFEIEDESI